MPLHFVEGNIVDMEADAIVNAANTGLLQGGGVCGAIFRAAGSEDMRLACEKAGSIQTGGATVTPGFALKAKYVIHTAGPVWQGGGFDERRLLSDCYINSMALAKELGIKSIAFPLISAGIYGFPAREALGIAVGTLSGCLDGSEDTDIFLVIYDRRHMDIGDELRSALWDRLSGSLACPPPKAAAHALFTAHNAHMRDICAAARPLDELPGEASGKARTEDENLRRLRELLSRPGESFTEILFRLIASSGCTDVEIYKRANMDRKLFSKIRSNSAYRPGKATVIALCIALELDMDCTRDLLKSAGYALSGVDRTDVILGYFIENGIYDIYLINEALFYYGEQPLGA